MIRQVVMLTLFGVFGAFIADAQQASRYEELPLTDPVPLRYGDSALGDFDRDGDQDLIMIGYAEEDPTPILGRDAGPIAGYYRNDGITQIEIVNSLGESELVDALAFTESRRGQSLIGLWQGAVAATDFNQDGRMDIGTLGLDARGDAKFYVYRHGTGASMFSLAYSLDGLYAGDLGWGDLDNDGDVDLVACGRNERGEPTTVHYENVGAAGNRFRVSTNNLMGVAECDLDIGDYDTDGDLDLVISGVTAKDGFITLIYDNVGGGRLTKTSHKFRSYGWPSVSWGDFDADGDLDLAYTGARITPSLLEGSAIIYRNDSGMLIEEDLLVGAFTNDPTPGRYSGSIEWADQNNSGYPDFVITGLESPISSESTQIYVSDAGSQFMKSSVESFDGGGHGIATWFDHDFDLSLDLFVMGDAPREGGLEIFVMQGTLVFGLTPPSAPANLTANTSATSVALSWEAAKDAHTPDAGLTYNLRVGKSPQGVDVISPLADPSTGRRFISDRGNVDHNRSWTLNGLSPGTYYWSVQALDQAFSSSKFSEEGVFEITRN
ncbi:MAG: FG-GAP-like repeat-containing protein [Bacteroidetes bacterium]|nr:FG-GAP-like repeat-containing protein [Bacteroidota bacterium]